MPRIVFLPFNSSVNGEKGKSLLDIAFENDILIEHNCGGLCACTSCKVIIKKNMSLLKEKSQEEKEILSNGGFTEDYYRLGCQCIIKENSEEEILVYIPL